MSDHKGGPTDPDDTFDRFFRPGAEDPDRTDPGVPTGDLSAQPTQAAPISPGAQYYQQPEQGAGYVEQAPRRQERSAVLPLIVLGLSLVVIAVVGYLFLRGNGSDSSATDTPIPTQATQPSQPSSTDSGGSSSTSSSSSEPSSSSSSSSSTSAQLPGGSVATCNNSGFSTSPGVTCPFATSVADNAKQNTAAGGRSTFQVTSASTHLTYTFNCEYPKGSFITCVGTSNPDNGRRPTVYVVPQA